MMMMAGWLVLELALQAVLSCTIRISDLLLEVDTAGALGVRFVLDERLGVDLDFGLLLEGTTNACGVDLASLCCQR